MEGLTLPSDTELQYGNLLTGAERRVEREYLEHQGDYKNEDAVSKSKGEDSDEDLEDKLLKIWGLFGKKNWVSKLDVDRTKQQNFLHENDSYLGVQPPVKVDNALYVIARKQRSTSTFLIRHMLERHKERMDDKDDV